MENSNNQKKIADAIRILAIDAVQQANSGHPGAPMGMAEMATALWMNNLHYNPKDPKWVDRDRFILSNGHGSMLLYALLHLTGYDISISDIKNFRQLHSSTPGHPEVEVTPGVEATTGPLGQGLGNAVGMAIAESLLAAEFNRPKFKIVDHFTYVFVGDGCLMEGISHEVCSLAGALGLSKLIVLYDSNGISIDGAIKHWFPDDTAKRFESYNWNVINHVDGHDIKAIDKAIKQAKTQVVKPSLIICKTTIGNGSPNMAGDPMVHGAPLGADEISEVRKALNWEAPAFSIPENIYLNIKSFVSNQNTQEAWKKKFDLYAKKYPSDANEFIRRMEGNLPENFLSTFNEIFQKSLKNKENLSTRKASQFVISQLVDLLPELLAGSADLTRSNLTDWVGAPIVKLNEKGTMQFGRYINYGVREFGMSSIMNGIALHGGYIPFGGTFLTFSDYSKSAIRMSALMKQRVIYVLTHDSIGLGEDGPTHQPVEQLASLRLIPNLSVWRPCDLSETFVAWYFAIQSKGEISEINPTALILSRQNLPHIERDPNSMRLIARGGYILSDIPGSLLIIIATGSEVSIALKAQRELLNEGIPVRVVSMPSTDTFDKQDAQWKNEVLPKNLPKIAIEAGIKTSWYKYVGYSGAIIGIDGVYGESAPSDVLFNYFGITTKELIRKVKEIL